MARCRCSDLYLYAEFLYWFRGSCCTVPTGSTEIHCTVIHWNSRNSQVWKCAAISTKADLSFYVVLWIGELQIQISQVPQSSVFVLFVPKDALKTRHMVWTVDLTVNRLIRFLNHETRCLEDIVGFRSPCEGKKRADGFFSYLYSMKLETLWGVFMV